MIKPRLLGKAGMGKIVVGYPSPYHITMGLPSFLKYHCLLNPYPYPKPHRNPTPCPLPTHALATPFSLLIPYTLPKTNHLPRFGFAYFSIPRFVQQNFFPPLSLVTNISRPPRDVYWSWYCLPPFSLPPLYIVQAGHHWPMLKWDVRLDKCWA